MTKVTVSLRYGSVSQRRNVSSRTPSRTHTTVFNAKRLIGRMIDDSRIVRDQKHWPFEAVKENDKFAIQFSYCNENRQFVSVRADSCYGFVLIYTVYS